MMAHPGGQGQPNTVDRLFVGESRIPEVRRTDLDDTSEKAWQMLLARLRELTPEQRLRMTFERIEASRDFRKRTEHLRRSSEAD
jgi:hypothetical protein